MFHYDTNSCYPSLTSHYVEIDYTFREYWLFIARYLVTQATSLRDGDWDEFKSHYVIDDVILTGKTVIILGDVHGYIDSLKELLTQVKGQS